MKELRNIIRAGLSAFSILCATVLFAGCGTTGVVYREVPDLPGAHRSVVTFHVGDLVTINFSSPLEQMIPPHEERVKDDGTITPPDIGSVKAEGKTTGELQKELQEKYDKLYRNRTVTVKSENRFYYVDGEVRQSGPKPYLGETDIVKAIAAAGGVTDFAKKSKIRLIHPNGSKEIISFDKAIDDSTYNRPVYPGDKIYVPRRLF